jgi:Raf kinase inhibitor-like YbhB/YbcL family protein
MRFLAPLCFVTLIGCTVVEEDGGSTSSGSTGSGTPGGMTLTSAAFANGATIPYKHGYLGAGCGPGTMNVSPALSWSGAPAGTKSFVLRMVDASPSAGGFVHWVAYDIGGGQSSLGEGVGAATTSSIKQSPNSYGDPSGYGGPCPPPGETHAYTFTIYALSVPDLGLMNAANDGQVTAAMAGKTLATGQLTGNYKP